MREDARNIFQKLVFGEVDAVYYKSQIITARGDSRTIQWYSTPLIESGEILGVLSSGEDITERMKFERELKELLHTYKTIVDLTPAMIFVHDENTIFFANRKAAECFRLEDSDSLIQFLMKLVSTDHRKKWETTPRNSIVEKITFPDGSEKYVEVLSNSIEYKEKQVILTIINDITDIVESHERILELYNILQFINKMLRHDVLNNLTSALTYLELYRETWKRDYLDKMQKTIQRAVRVIQSIRDLESTLRGELKAVNVRKVIEEAVSKYDFKINVKGNCVALADDFLCSVIDNIVENAIRHSKTDTIDIEITSADGFCEIRILDYGIGIPNELKDKIFEEGFRFGESANTGLGLYIVKKIVEYYGGEIWVEDNKPKGSIFIIRLKKVEN